MKYFFIKILYLIVIFLFVATLNPEKIFSHITKASRNEQAMLGLYYDFTTELATKTLVKIKESPAIMTVFTEEEIKSMGARDLIDVLNLVPVITLQTKPGAYTINLRGISTIDSEKILFMVDGHTVNVELTGGAGFHFIDMPIENIKKVEVMRGTGSSLYGANAFVGLINVVTKKAEDIDGVSFATRHGSFDSHRYYLEAGKKIREDFNVWANVNYYNTDGEKIFVETDSLNKNPKSPNAKISNAPGYNSEMNERTDLNLGAEIGHFTFKGILIDKKTGAYFNAGGALSDDTNTDRKYMSGILTYKDSFFDENINIKSDLYLNKLDYNTDLYLSPPGFINAQKQKFLLGRRSQQRAYLEEYGFDTQLDTSIKKHDITFGFEAKNSALHDVAHWSNYCQGLPLEGFHDTSKNNNWILPADRFFYGIFMQDQYALTDDLTLYAGIRYDNYDDSSNGNVSPNLSLVYKFFENWRAKLIYGEAFRAPNFADLYKLPAGAPRVGNSDVKPEKAVTYQAGIEWDASERFNAGLYAFRNKYKDMISEIFNPATQYFEAQNTGEIQTKGIELTFHFHPIKNKPQDSIFLNFSYTDTEDEFGEEFPAAPKWLVSGGLDWEIIKKLAFNINFNYIGDSKTSITDSREEFSSWWLANMSLTAKDMFGYFKGMDLRSSVYNLFDQDYSFPDITNSYPDNYNRPGISAEIGVTYRF